MASTHMGVSIDPTTLKSGTLRAAFDPTTHLQTRGFGATVSTGTAKAGALGTPIVSAAVASTGGTLPANTSHVYHVHAVNALGEGAAGTVTATIAAALSAPVQSAATVTTSDGGIFGSTGNKFYKITATNAIGETTGSGEQSANVAATTSSVTLHWAAVAGATGYKIYRGTATGAEDHLVGTVGSGTTLLFKDTGSTGTVVSPPGSNTTSTSTNKVTLTWPAVSGETAGFKVYRDGLHLGDVANGATRTLIDTGGVTPTGAEPTTVHESVRGGHKGGSSAPKPVDGGEQ